MAVFSNGLLFVLISTSLSSSPDFRAALNLHKQGREAEAEPLYMKAIIEQMDHVSGSFRGDDAFNNLALLLANTRPVEASKVWWMGWRSILSNEARTLLLANYDVVHRAFEIDPARFQSREFRIAPKPSIPVRDGIYDETFGKLMAVISAHGRLFDSQLLSHTYSGISNTDFEVVSGILHQEALISLQEYYRQRTADGTLPFGDMQSLRYAMRNEGIANFVKHALLPLATAVAGVQLTPTYSYLSLYEHGADLPVHTDKEDSSYVISLTIDKTPQGVPWPMLIQRQQQAEPVGGSKTPRDLAHTEELPDSAWHSVDWGVNEFMMMRGRHHAHKRGRMLGERHFNLLLFYQPDDKAPEAKACSKEQDERKEETRRKRKRRKTKGGQAEAGSGSAD